MKNNKIKILICIVLVLSLTVISACTDTDKDIDTDTGNGNNVDNNNDINNQNGINDNENNQDGGKVEPPRRNPDQDVDLTQSLLEDEEVLDGQIYLRDEWAIGAMTLKDEVSVERAQEIAQKYAQQIKEKYSDKKVNVQVILNGENVANIEL